MWFGLVRFARVGQNVLDFALVDFGWLDFARLVDWHLASTDS